MGYNLTQNKSYLFVNTISIANRESRINFVGNNILEYQLVESPFARIFRYLEKKELELFLFQVIFASSIGEAWVFQQILTKLIGIISG